MAYDPEDDVKFEEIRKFREYSKGWYEQRTAGQSPFGANNPVFGTDPYNPLSYLPQVDPSAAQPFPDLPTTQFLDPQFNSPLVNARVGEVQEWLDDPEAWIEKNQTALTQEQSLMDRGASMMSRLFDYEDDADLNMFGIPLAWAEGAWDGGLRYLTGFFDVVNVGLTGAISAAPGGIQTLSPDELTGGMTSEYGVLGSFQRVLSGELSGEERYGSAPSAGQAFVASIGIEAGRIRRGETRVSDVLLANPVTGPFILAALAAETSPIQKVDFDFTDREMRDEAFGKGWEKWMSGITDAGLMFADPLIGVGVAAKFARIGALGSKMVGENAIRFNSELMQAVDLIDERMGRAPGTTRQEAERLVNESASRQSKPPKQAHADIVDNNPIDPATYEFIPGITPGRLADDVDYGGNEIARLLHRVTERNTDGTKVMSAAEISRMVGIQESTNRGDIATLLFDSQSPYEAALVLDMLAGNRASKLQLERLAPALADETFRVQRDILSRKIAVSPDTMKEVVGTLTRSTTNLKDQLTRVTDDLKRLESQNTPESFIAAGRLREEADRLTASLDDLEELSDIAKGNPPSAGIKDDEVVKAVIDDLKKRSGFYDRVNASNLMGSEMTNRFWLPSKNNMYSRAVMRSRERRGKARYQYSMEGAGILPHKVITGIDPKTKKPTYESQGWFSESMFPDVNRFQRAMRVWRWLGDENPSGYIGLKGTATVGSEREIDAALKIDMYQGDNLITLADGRSITGRQRKQELTDRLLSAINDPNQDAFTVLRRVEDEVANDLYMAYLAAFDTGTQNAREGMLQVIRRARNVRKEYDRQFKDGYFVDEDDVIHEVPYLDSQLAGGDYMLPLREIERQLQKEAKSIDGGRKIHQHLAEGGAYYISRADQYFQAVWRPATLLRMSYPVRNTLEGVVRAAAYQASLTPFTWPVRGLYNGVRGGIKKRAVEKQAKIAERKIEGSQAIAKVQTDMNNARRTAHFLENAVPTRNKAGEEVWEVYDANRNRRLVTEDELVNEKAQAQSAIAQAEADLGKVAADFDAAVKDTKFDDWRKEQIKAVNARIEENNDALRVFEDTAQLTLGDDWMLRLTDEQRTQWAEMLRADLYEIQQLDMLRYQPARALAAYRTIAGRQRRIGSGTSMAPDGSRYADAFLGPYAAINRQLLSADKTTQQRLQVRFDAMTSLFEQYQQRPNQAIRYSARSEDAWAAGVANFIEQASSSFAVRRLIEFDGDTIAALAAIEQTAEGRMWIKTISNIFAEQTNMKDVPLEEFILKPTERVPAFAETVEGPLGLKLTVLDRDKANLYLEEVWNRVNVATQRRVTDPDGNPLEGFFGLLATRAREKDNTAGRFRDPVETDLIGEVNVDAANVKSIIAGLSDDTKAQFGAIAGDEMIRMGLSKFGEFYRGVVNKAFKWAGTIPEDSLVRGPFYNQRFIENRNLLIRSYLEQTNPEALQKGTVRMADGTPMEGGLKHGEFTIPSEELNRIMVLSHRRALADTREWLYTIERRTNLGKYGEYIFPFISASQNSVTVIGKLLYKEPWLVPFIANLWRVPNVLEIEDEDGNILMPVPENIVTEWLAKNPSIPIIGGVYQPGVDQIRIAKDGANMFLPDTGFGPFPRPQALVQVSVSEAMKANFIQQETPNLLKAFMGDDEAEKFWGLFQDWVFGEEMGMSAEFASYDRLFPAFYQKVIKSKDELSSKWGFYWMNHYTTQMALYKSRQRDDMPGEEELNKRTTNSILFEAVGNAGIPTPLTPYPIVTRPQIKTPALDVLRNEYQKLMQADPLNANFNMQNMYGDWALEFANTKVTENVGGAIATDTAISDINTLEPLLARVAGRIPTDNLDVLGMLVNNRSSAAEYDQSAYAWQKASKIPGTNREWREVSDPIQSVKERQRLAGWTTYQQYMDYLEAQMQSAGVESMEVKAGYPYKMAKDQMILNMSSNPDFAGWWEDYQDRGGMRTNAAVIAMEEAVADPTFVNLMVSNEKTQLVSIMNEYVSQRRNLLSILESTGKSIEHDDNLIYKVAWAKMRQDWKNSDPRWAEIANRYLSSDDNPQSPGMIQQQLAATEMLGEMNE